MAEYGGEKITGVGCLLSGLGLVLIVIACLTSGPPGPGNVIQVWIGLFGLLLVFSGFGVK